MYTGSIPHVGYDSEVRSLETVHRLRYFRFCNVLHIWTIRAIPTYRVYRLYDITSAHRVHDTVVLPHILATVPVVSLLYTV